MRSLVPVLVLALLHGAKLKGFCRCDERGVIRLQSASAKVIVAWRTTTRFVEKAAADFPLHSVQSLGETADRDLTI